MCLAIVWSFIEFQLVVFKLCSRQEKNIGEVTKGNNSLITLDRVMVLQHCTLNPLIVLDHWSCFELQLVVFKLCSLQGKVTKGKNSVISQMELWFLCTALPLNLLDHCMKLYLIPTSSFQIMLQTRKKQWKSNKEQ
jgi:hypothetical protein